MKSKQKVKKKNAAAHYNANEFVIIDRIPKLHSRFHNIIHTKNHISYFTYVNSDFIVC